MERLSKSNIYLIMHNLWFNILKKSYHTDIIYYIGREE